MSNQKESEILCDIFIDGVLVFKDMGFDDMQELKSYAAEIGSKGCNFISRARYNKGFIYIGLPNELNDC